MKRCFSIALILALLVAIALPPVLAEAPEIVSENIDEVVAPATDAGDTGLTIEDPEEAPEEIPEEALEETPEDTPVEEPEEGPEEEPVWKEFDVELAARDLPVQKATSIRINRSSVSIGLKEKYEGLAVVAQPEGSAVSDVTWRSGNTKYVRVNSKTGVIRGVRKGTAYVYAQTADGLKARCKVRVKAKPKGIALEPGSMTISAGMTGILAATVTGGASGKVTYTSSKPRVATVDEEGRITARAKGKATITAETYNGKTATCKVKVLKAAASLAFESESVSVAVGKKITLKAKAYDSSGKTTVADITYAIDRSSADATCIQVDSITGVLTAVSRGSAVVTATTHNNIVARCEVNVTVAPAGVTLSPESATIGVGETRALTATLVAPEGETDCASDLSWKSSKNKIATVNGSGVVTGVKAGSCTITVTTENGKKATCTVTVRKAPKKISISPSVGSLRVGKTGRYKVSTSPSGSGGGVSYDCSDTSVATIDENGRVTAVSMGEAYVTVTTYNGKSAKAKLVVTDDASGKTNEEKIKYLTSLARAQLGKPYIYGSGYSDTADPRGFDCSGLVYWLYRHVGVTLKDTAYKQGYDSRYTRLKMSELKAGDVIFFNTNSSDSDLSDHSAYYIGDGKFIHASSSAGKVIISDLSTKGSYYYRTFSWGHRILS